jgi:hypothetical protein
MLLEMLRPLRLVLALATAALLAPAPLSAAAIQGAPGHYAEIEFGFPAGRGLHASVETSSEGITLKIAGRHRFVTYRAQGESTEAGLKVQFGSLGLIDVAFTPTKTSTDEPPKGCTGPPSTSSIGIFTGTIHFTGEREYVRIEQTEAKGSLAVWRESEWRCRRKRLTRPHVIRAAAGASRARSRAKREPASLAVIDRRCSCLFAAFSTPERQHRPSSFFGAKFEEVEGMEIARVTYADAGARTFVFDHAAGTATVRPPLPITGSATFKRRPHNRDLWRSTIEVPLLGADPLSVRAPSYRARLVRALPGGE